MSLRSGIAGCLLSLMGLAACGPVMDADVPAAREAALVAAPRAQTSELSERSQALAEYYASVQLSLLTQDLLRVDGGGPDTPYGARQLEENFIQIATFNELTPTDFGLLEIRSESTINRWVDPVRIDLHFGSSVSDEQRRADRSFVTNFARRLARVTGAQISTTRSSGNFHVLVVNVDELQALGPTLQGLVPRLSENAARQMITLTRDVYCTVYMFDGDTPNAFETGVALIRAEHPPLMRQSCFHEEIAQGLGLSNDSPNARPSIFNDNDEFALLTSHDELLLKMLYDPRMPLGATAQQAQPIARILARELTGEDI